MSSNNDFTDEERVVVLHHLSRGSSLNDVLRLLLENLAKNRTELEVEGMVEACNNQQENQRKSLARGPEKHGKKWDRDAVDGVIADLARNLPNGRVEELMNIHLKDEITVQNDKAERDQVEQNLQEMGIPAGEQHGTTNPSNPAGDRDIAIGNAAIPWSAIPVALPPTNSTIPAPVPSALGKLGGSPAHSLNPPVSGTNLGRLWEAFEAQNYPLGGPQRTDPHQSPLLYSPGTGSNASGSGGGNSGERESASVHKRGSGSSADGEDQGGDGIE